jgi:UPF0755 protein
MVHRRRRKRPRPLGFFYFLPVFLLIAAWSAGFLLLGPQCLPAKEAVVQFSREETSDRIGQQLYQQGLIWNRTDFLLEARRQHLDEFFSGGEYLISSQLSVRELVSEFKEHQVLRYQFTLLEGSSVRQMGERLAKTPLVSLKKNQSTTSFIEKELFLELVLEGGDQFPSELGADNKTTSLEGYLYPSTYTFERMSETKLVRSLMQELEKQVSLEWRKRASDLGWSFHQVLTLASIVEKEAGDLAEMPIISSVFHNRLLTGMLLQSDPTVEYAIQAHHFPLTPEELATDSPYNTYLYPGLPVGPICNPGRQAIEAALFPAQTDYYYFVAKGDGTHLFGRTYEEHLANIASLEEP